MQHAANEKPVLVLGGNGKTGHRVVARLQEQGRPVRSVSRSTTPRFDWLDAATWAGVLDGVGSVYITYQPDLAVPGALDHVQAFTDLALSKGVRRLVLLSGRGEDEAQKAERALQDSGADWTIVRASWFAQNFSENFLIEGVLAGEVVLPTVSAKEPFIDADDIADVVVAALTDDRHIGQLYEVTGPRLMTFGEAVANIAAASGRTIGFTQVAPDEYKKMLEQVDLPDGYIDLVMYLMTNILDGRNEYLADGVQRALGRAPKDFNAYVADVAATGVWAA